MASSSQQQQQQQQGAFVIVVSVKKKKKNDDATTTTTSTALDEVEEFIKYIQSVLPPSFVQTFELSKGIGRQGIRGKLVLSPTAIQNETTANTCAELLRQSTFLLHYDDGHHQPAIIAAQVDPVRRRVVAAAASPPPPPPQQRTENTTTSHEEDEDDSQDEVVMEEEEEEEDDDDDDGGAYLHWKNSKAVASKFFRWLHAGNYYYEGGVEQGSLLLDDDDSSIIIDLNSVEREKVHWLFEAFCSQHPSLDAMTGNSMSNRDKKQRRRLESLVMAVLKSQKLAKVKRYSDDGVVVCSFARSSDHTFAPFEERQTARELLRQAREILTADKGGILVSQTPTTTDPSSIAGSSSVLLPINQQIIVTFSITSPQEAENNPNSTFLTNVRQGGSHKKSFHFKTKLPCQSPDKFQLSFSARNTGVYRTTLLFQFKNTSTGERFEILRSVLLRAGGDAKLYDMIQPTAPYVKRERKKYEKPTRKQDILHPPRDDVNDSRMQYKKLQRFKVPLDVRAMVESREMEGALVPPTYDMPDRELVKVYRTFWKNLLWISELQAYDDIKLFDMENAKLQRAGRFFKLHISGLAEGRPSVLRGDLIICKWKGKEYRGLVYAVELLDILMEFHDSFHRKFNVSLDRVDLVRFTFSRTSFRTSHAGCVAAPKAMGPRMLAPQAHHVERIERHRHQIKQRVVPQQFAWASPTLNDEQKKAVQEIAKGMLRPLPYIIFGPPGTGKTTTIIEAVYQLARLHNYDSKQPKLKILLVAPSNDATDLLVERLSPCFPPSEMTRILAFTRSIDQVPPLAKPYVHKDLKPSPLLSKISSVQVVVTTINLAARLWCTCGGLKKGCFDVICVDEAGQATEPEVIGAAATLMKFSGQDTGQMVLAGDPNQLGPIITSDLCKKFGLDVSFMERLVKTSPAYCVDDIDSYPPELVTLLVRNYRSHPVILKLPNEMFYHNKLIPCGDQLSTHSMTKWEHLPNRAKGFPIVFHAVDGENQREGDSPSWFNPQEAILVTETVNSLVKDSRPAIRQDEIGVITPYARQVQKIRTLLKAQDMGDVKVGSVETFQGQERRCIIISTVRSENDLLEYDRKYNLGFVANEKRFNVAITRAKALLVVIGNPKVLETDKKNWLPLLRYCRDNKSWMGGEWVEETGVDKDGDEMQQILEASKRDEEEHDEDGWEAVTDQEARGYINREE